MSFRTQMSGDDGEYIRLSVDPICMDRYVVSISVKKNTVMRELKETYSEMEGVEVHT